jgi:SAM-dependent methyltransferase
VEFQSEGGTAEMGDSNITGSQRRRLDRELAHLERYKRKGLIVEIGPGKGWFLVAAQEAGWKTVGVEVNARAAAYLAESLRGAIIRADVVEAELPVEAADVVRMWDVIEHLPNPKAALQKLHRSLRRGGIIELSTTNFSSLSRMINGPEWVYLNGADHIHLFDPLSIKKMLHSVGFSDVQVRTRSFNLRRKLYFPERTLPQRPLWLKPFRKIIDELIQFTQYGHQMIVAAIKPYSY